jgi:PAS domain S-box-containing protein
MITSPTGRLQEVNASWLRMFGYTHSEAMTLSLEDLFDPEELAVDPVRYDRVARSGSLIRRRRLKRKDGSIFPGDINATWFSGKHILTIVRDISDQVYAEQELRASEAKYRSVVENAGDGIVLADRNGRVIDGNRRAMEMVGYSLEEGKGSALTDFLSADDAQANPPDFPDIIARGSILRERILRRRDGTELQVMLALDQLDSEGHQHHRRHGDRHPRTAQQQEPPLQQARQTGASDEDFGKEQGEGPHGVAATG